MQEVALTEWLNSPGTKALLAYLHRRQVATLQLFLVGETVHPVRQGRVAALHELERLLTSPVDNVRKIFNDVLKE